jgi:anaerobic selenocysteine-containing dehydrogenase/Fe-S-cluster-containing dehydrogenase component
MKRRTFLKISGIGVLSIAAGCNTRPDKTLFSLVEAPDDMVTGKASWYATTCRECPAGCGILAKNREGRIIKVEGHPYHPINKGALCMRGQASVQAIYHPDRIKSPMLKEKDTFKAISFDDAQELLRNKAATASGKGPNKVHMVTEVVGESLFTLFSDTLHIWKSPPPIVFEPFAYESLKQANHKVFGIEGLASYRMEQADLLVSFGADFLETWLSPIEYSRKFKAMHAIRNGAKGAFVYVSPFQSLTGVNADLWLSCKPGQESVVALGLIREVLAAGGQKFIPQSLKENMEKAVIEFTPEKVIEIAGVSPEHYQKLVQRILNAKHPLILGTGVGLSGPSTHVADIAANYLNIILDPELSLIDFKRRHRVETASPRKQVVDFFNGLKDQSGSVLLLNNVNPVYALSPEIGVREILESKNLFVVSFSNFMDETTELADLIFPTSLALESWDEYAGNTEIVSALQPAMGMLFSSWDIGDIFLKAADDANQTAENYKDYLYQQMIAKGVIKDELDRLHMIQRGGIFDTAETDNSFTFSVNNISSEAIETGSLISKQQWYEKTENLLIAVPSIRFFDGRSANRPWLGEVPDPLTKVAWQTPVLIHPDTLAEHNLVQGDLVRVQTKNGFTEALAYETENVRPGVVVMSIGQGHERFGRYAENMGLNPLKLIPGEVDDYTGGPIFSSPVFLLKLGSTQKLANMDGSRFQYDRKIALTISLAELAQKADNNAAHDKKAGLAMWDFPMTLPLPEGYDKKRDFYPSHVHEDYRWAMVIDLDRCIGCESCAVACYAENNVGVVGLKGILEQREMSWLMIQRYLDPQQPEKIIFLPMLCQHCDNAPCESVCPVYAPHHSKEGLNNQVYNRCIGTRFCSQNCPYKVRRFNWFTWKWPEPLNMQLNPDVTVRSKGVMEKCSFCVQRIKAAHGKAKDEKREIRDGEIMPACLQTCPTGVFTFGNLMDKNSKVRQMVDDLRAYQVLGYLNTKPAVIYLKKVLQEI